MPPIITAHQLTKYYGKGKEETLGIGPVDFEIEQSSFTIIIGKSGSGKSTLLNLLAGLDSITHGNLTIQGKPIHTLSSKQLAKYRKTVGIIFQFYNLLPNLSTIENILISDLIKGNPANKKRAVELLNKFGLAHRENANIKTLSGGEKQRVAIARSLISHPTILFCDEPTGALDSANEDAVRDILLDLYRHGMTIVMVTHNDDFKHLADTIIEMKDGLITSIKQSSLKKVQLKLTKNGSPKAITNPKLSSKRTTKKPASKPSSAKSTT
jgi:putative ABC transport system ATP-binding protein